MSNMSYCRHENTSGDLHDVLVQWDDWAVENQPQPVESYESRARRHIMAQAVALTRALEERELLLADDSVAEHAEYEILDIAFPLPVTAQPTASRARESAGGMTTAP